MSSIDSLAQILVQEWVRLYNARPTLTVTITLALSIAGGGVAYFAEQRNQETRGAQRLQNLNYASQARTLDETRSNLTSLIEFVDNEKRQLQLSEKALESMKSEHERFKPLVESDRKVIDALFAAQEVRNDSAQNRERWIGFGLGVLASLIASVVWAVGTYVMRKKQPKPAV